ncbi:vWA domain-containing protein [Anatilimnocola floriformis]|uniref:vWA domain-containing protein n=1 Tax=Anatilimnocola floriformis TaxID=2948575 RepID=UPI0020C54143|nr:vWA domain-containing protein [Anatilimnocola floriformis]
MSTAPDGLASPLSDEALDIDNFEEFEDVDSYEEIVDAPAPPAPAKAAAPPIAPTPPAVPAKSPPPAVKPPAAVVAPPPKVAAAVAKVAAPPVTLPAPDDEFEPIEKRSRLGMNWGVDGAAFLGSVTIHLIGMLILAVVLTMFGAVPAVIESTAPLFASSVIPEPEKREILTFELDPQMALITEQSKSTTTNTAHAMAAATTVGDGRGGTGFGSGGMGGAGGGSEGDGPGTGGTGGGMGGFDRGVADVLAGIGGGPAEEMFIDVPSSRKLISGVPDGQVGEARAVVENYDQALDRVTQEILWMLDKGPVLVIWAFDQSESMKDDQVEIRDRIDHVYKQLGLVSKHNRDALQTAVVSYGEGYVQHTKQPTSDWYEIKACIDEVPTDPSGKEMMCSAVTQAIGTHRGYAQKQNRRIALILCTDESGEPADNQTQLERTVAELKSANAKLFVLGREATFGYPYAHLGWTHPQTGHHHWIRIDRGPETAFVEQLQTDGFHRRYDAHLSGFGPYEQTRMSHETGGIFFVLPSKEINLVRADNKKYEFEAMRRYMPDIRSRLEVGAETEKSELRKALTKVIYDLNPYNPEISKIIEMRVHFSPDVPNLLKQIEIECAKSTIYGEYLSRVERDMQKLESYRANEASPRWQANYDLIYAQIIAYQARMFEYRAYLMQFGRNPRVVPEFKPPNLRHTGWDIATRKETITGAVVQPYIDRATTRFHAVIAEHPGTPWAARAEYELKRGFGVHLIEEYHRPDRGLSTGETLMPVPKM